jgi:hypothetical protein
VERKRSEEVERRRGGELRGGGVRGGELRGAVLAKVSCYLVELTLLTQVESSTPVPTSRCDLFHEYTCSSRSDSSKSASAWYGYTSSSRNSRYVVREPSSSGFNRDSVG